MEILAVCFKKPAAPIDFLASRLPDPETEFAPPTGDLRMVDYYTRDFPQDPMTDSLHQLAHRVVKLKNELRDALQKMRKVEHLIILMYEHRVCHGIESIHSGPVLATKHLPDRSHRAAIHVSMARK